MKTVKYILSILLILGGFIGVVKGDFITGLSILILGGILLPPISEKIKKQIILFQNKKIRYGVYIGLFIIAGAFAPKSDADVFGSKEDVLIKYIKNNKNDKSLQNIKSLSEIGGMFNNINVSTIYPHQGYISEQYDSIKKVAILTFNAKFDYNKSDDISYLKEDAKNGKFKDYSVQYEINNNDSITIKKTTITYSKIIKEFLSINDVPSIETFVDETVIENRKKQIVVEEKIANERRKFNDIMGDDDFWKNYDSMAKKRIYNLIVNKDCRGLQNEFNIADNNSKSQLRRTGTGNAELMSFIDKKMRSIDCYSN